MIAVSGWSISCAAPATNWPKEASFSLCTRWLCKRCSFSKLRRESSSRWINAWSWRYWRTKTNTPSTSIAAKHSKEAESPRRRGRVVPSEGPQSQRRQGKNRQHRQPQRHRAPLVIYLGRSGFRLPLARGQRGGRHPAYRAYQRNVIETSRVVLPVGERQVHRLRVRARKAHLPPSGSGTPFFHPAGAPRAAIPSTNTSTPLSTR